MTKKKKSPEDILREKVLDALRNDPQNSRVEDKCGSVEYGVDITFEREDSFGKPRLYGVQIKSGNLSSRKSKASQNVKELIGQLSIAFGHRFPPQDQPLDAVYVVIGGEIKPHASEHIKYAHIGFRHIYFLDNQDLERFFILREPKTKALKET